MDAELGLGILVAPAGEGTARILTVTEEHYSAMPEHEYRYDLELSGTVEARQLWRSATPGRSP
jgi:hypothetical protein